MLFSGIAARALVVAASGAGILVLSGKARWKRIKELIARAAADTTKVTTSANLGEPGDVIGRTAEVCFDPFPRLSLLGTCGLPRSSLYKLNTCKRSPCFTSHSPRSCKCGCHCPYSDRSSATCRDKRICPASPQSITRWATLIPDPAMFVLSLTSVTRLTGPL
jgi:hypothetical protein